MGRAKKILGEKLWGVRKVCAQGEGPKPSERKRKKRKKIERRVSSVYPRVST